MMVPDEAFAARQRRTKVVTRHDARPLNFSKDGLFVFPHAEEIPKNNILFVLTAAKADAIIHLNQMRTGGNIETV